MRRIVLLAHDIRSRHNVGSLLRTADGLGVERVYLTGYTPYPRLPRGDPRLPHLAAKEHREIAKTALGTERFVTWQHRDTIEEVVNELRHEGFELAALEQAAGSIPLAEYSPPGAVALLLGREVEGIAPELLARADAVIELPMLGRKESLNVVQAAAIALYQLRYHS